MLGSIRGYCPTALVCAASAMGVMVLAAGIMAAQDPPFATQPNVIGIPITPIARLVSDFSFSAALGAGSGRWQGIDLIDLSGGNLAGANRNQVFPEGIPRRITLEQVKQQQVADTAASNPLVRLGQLSIEAAKQHRLGVQADYYPKISATVMNLHFSEFMGEFPTIPHPIVGSGAAIVPIPLVAKDQTLVALTFTPLFQVAQLVKIARADERIAKAKAGVSISKRVSDSRIGEAYFRRLTAQRRMISAQQRLKTVEAGPLYASASLGLARAPTQEPGLMDANKALMTTATEVKELTASLNRMMGWAEDTELELVPPEPLVENTSLQEVADSPVGANAEVIEAEQTAVKARAALVLSKLSYMPTVAAVSGFVYQNALPALPNTFGYGGVMVSYNIFDFGKRERGVKEAGAQREMAEMAVQLTKAKVAAAVKTSYSELERARQVSQLTQKMGSSVAKLMNVSSTSENPEIAAPRANVEVDMFEADLAHRLAYLRLKELMDPQGK
jgi:Outer membrane efflux protein